ncbi:MAG: hypothetical protein A3H28_15980 [Acidobacteria bacterium RIFCSPLOWO2_02_FULL_61_28]|nr:MAG: hypothetical protein A3H28_15980 [Acidobacteria bacterium RIFCSPLOWO2_02_FULL_61_28]
MFGPNPPLSRGTDDRGSRFQAARLLAVETYGKLPLSFEENKGQTAGAVKFMSRAPGYTVFLTSTEAVLALREPQKSEVRIRAATVRERAGTKSRSLTMTSREPGSGESDVTGNRALLRMKLLGANSAPRATGLEELHGKSNYFLGHDPAQWRANVPTFAKVRIASVYRGVDLIYYGNQRQLEYDFVVEPGADPSAIRLGLEGAERVEVDAQGDLVAEIADEQVRFRKPVIYQEAHGVRQQIGGGYMFRADRTISFQVDDYDAAKPLVIDPVLTYSTYLGGGGLDEINAVAVDTAGNIYVTGETDSTNFPLSGPLQEAKGRGSDAFVAKLNPAANALQYATYLGGTGTDIGTAIAVDSLGNAYLTGHTDSTSFPTTAGALQRTSAGGPDAFVSRLNANGSALTFSTYLGGDRTDRGFGIALDAPGNIYITGRTNSANFPTASPFQANNGGLFDAFAAKLNPVGSSLMYATYYGGTQDDYGYGIAADGTGGAYLTGFTESNNFPTINPIQSIFGGGTCGVTPDTFPCPDVFVAKLNPAGSAPVYSTYLGGGNDDEGYSIAVDSSGAAYLTGVTVSTDFRTANPFQAVNGGGEDAFVAKLNPGGSQLVYSTYLGGAGEEAGNGIAVDSSGSATVAGYTQSSAFPLVYSLHLRASIIEAFVTKFTPLGSQLVYSTFLGGNSTDQAFGIAVDPSGTAYVVGGTQSSNFPTASPLQGTFAGGTCGTAFDTFTCPDGFIARLVFRSALNPGGVVNNASYAPGAAVAGGSIAAAFGTDLAASLVFASTLPLPTTLGSITIRMNNIPAPLIFVSGNQLALQVPWELAGQTQATVVASIGATALSPVTLNLAATAPGIFSTNQRGSGQGAILIANSDALAAPVGSIPGRNTRPANRGEFVTIYCTGLGGVTNRPASGAPAPANPLSRTTATPAVTIGGIAATVNFSGLSPGFVGLYQVDAQVPESSPTGSVVPVQISIGGATSNPVTIAVQ